MSKVVINFNSKYTNKEQIINCYYPSTNVDKVLILLHGLGGNQDTIGKFVDLEAYASKYNALIVTPNGDRSFYTWLNTGEDYSKYLQEEVIDMVDNLLTLDINYLPVYIGGISMGGYGALQQVVLYPDFYQGLISISGSVDIMARDEFKRTNQDTKEEWIRMFGDKIDPKHDLFSYKLPNIKYYLACGEDDYLMFVSKRLAKNLEDNKLDYRFDIDKGEHNKEFFYSYLEKAIDYMLG